MAQSAQLGFQDVRGGMNAADPPNKIGPMQYARAVNCAIVDGMLTTRFGGRVVPVSGDLGAVVSEAPMQGSIFFNPAKGQGGIVLSQSNPTLAAVIGGRKILFNIEGRRSNAKAVARDISDGRVSSAQSHMAWLSQWENLLIVADGESRTFIYDPETGSSLSKGYNTVEKDKSQIPNGATAMAYCHARGVAVVNSRAILVGDSLHRTNLTRSVNLIDYTEQVYWATGQHFVPPTSMGGVTALIPLPLKNTNNGQGDLIAMCEDGCFSIHLNEYPRSTWSEKPMVKITFQSAGASGAYAIAASDGDLVFRTRKGVQTYRSAAATAGVEGNPEQTLSSEVDTWFLGDYPRWLRFASVCVWSSARRILFTVSPIVRGSFRWHRGMVVRNTDTSPTSPNTPPVWEGLWTFPPETSGIVQFVNGLFDGEERQFVWTRGMDAKNRLLEILPTLRADVLEDGSERPIRCQVITRAIDVAKWWEKKEFTDVRLYLQNIATDVRWGVWFRPSERRAWKFLRAGTIKVPPSDLTIAVTESRRSAAIALGTLPKDCQPDGDSKLNETAAVQFLIRWEGFCSLEGIKVDHGNEDLSRKQLDKDGLAIEFKPLLGDEYDDFEYSTSNIATWLPETK